MQINVHLYMLALCAFMIFQLGYWYLKPAFLHNFSSLEDNRAYWTFIYYELHEFTTHNYSLLNLIGGSICLALIYLFMRVGNYAYRQLFIYGKKEIKANE